MLFINNYTNLPTHNPNIFHNIQDQQLDYKMIHSMYYKEETRHIDMFYTSPHHNLILPQHMYFPLLANQIPDLIQKHVVVPNI